MNNCYNFKAFHEQIYTRKGLTLAVSIVTFKLNWREGGKASTS